ncbi:GTP 3',8-cyclase MoaA [Elusimicrobiota bacterium]
MIDSLERKIDYLRLSVTDKCNLRCIYCLPAGKRSAATRHFREECADKSSADSFVHDYLTNKEIVHIASIAIKLGINKFRITGGEPLVRPGICDLTSDLISLKGVNDVSLTTNGVLLNDFTRDLRAVGLKRINISLDTLNNNRFKEITRFGDLENVIAGIESAIKVGFDPIKINVVVMKGINSAEIHDFVNFAKQYRVHVRFIELMPIGEAGFLSTDRWLSLPEIMKRCGPLEPLEESQYPKGFGPAIYFKAPGSKGTIGFIGALSAAFCQNCNRLRLTSKGKLLPCLASDIGIDLKTLLRSRAADQDLANLIVEAVSLKPGRHDMKTTCNKTAYPYMCMLGG